MATFHRQDDQVHMFVKGAPDVLLARCECWLVGGEDRPLNSGDRRRIDAEYLALAEGGLRGLLIASRTIPASAFDASGDLLASVNGLTFIGLAGLMDPPRPEAKEAPVLSFSRLAKIMAYGITMMVGTLAVLYYGLHIGTEQRALTLAFTTFVLFQFLNVFNARTEKGTFFNAHFFDNMMLWVSLAGIIALQALAVHWPRAQPIFGTGGMTLADWGIATGVAASVLILEEGRKLALAMLWRLGPRATPAGSV